ncbi:MAG: translation initiation factor IF-2 subunit gamma [Candidatus Nanohaloarchaeota archaeon]|nr:translation initiation factor IF-2 subunit gamma [Candidatus Nanohaloarchaeota archaeon]
MVSKDIPSANIGIFGHVDHGKTTLTQILTGKFTDEHSEELKRGISIRLGYADLSVRKCPKCEGSKAYTTFPKCFYCGSDTELLRTVSIIDVPGHETLLATVLTGTALIDGAILVIAANEPCPQPQTVEHLTALEIAGIKNIIIVQNKIDLVSKERALESYKEIKEFVKGTVAENAPIIPISAHHNVNVDVILEAIEKYIPTPKRDETKPPIMYVARSFDVNKPGTLIDKLVGGVLGGAVAQGVFKKGDEIEIRPGIKKGEDYVPVKTKITSLHQSKQEIDKARPGGLIAVGTQLDPFFTKSDAMVGNVVTLPENAPPIRRELLLDLHIIERILENNQKIHAQIQRGDVVLMNVGTARTIGVCVDANKGKATFKLKLPIAAYKGERVVLSKQIEGRWRLIGYGVIDE